MGQDLGKKLPKQFTQINGENLIHFFLKRIDTNNFDKNSHSLQNNHILNYLGKT